MKKKTNEINLSDHSLILDHDNFRQENQYEKLKSKFEQMTKLLTEKDEIIIESQTDLNYPKDQLDQNRLIELQQKFNSI
ncbi:unnamed protein product, partial [Rotaria sordida]